MCQPGTHPASDRPKTNRFKAARPSPCDYRATPPRRQAPTGRGPRPGPQRPRVFIGFFSGFRGTFSSPEHLKAHCRRPRFTLGSALPRGANTAPPATAPVAQLDRALPSEGRGRTFESCRVRQIFLNKISALENRLSLRGIADTPQGTILAQLCKSKVVETWQQFARNHAASGRHLCAVWAGRIKVEPSKRAKKPKCGHGKPKPIWIEASSLIRPPRAKQRSVS